MEKLEVAAEAVKAAEATLPLRQIQLILCLSLPLPPPLHSPSLTSMNKTYVVIVIPVRI